MPKVAANAHAWGDTLQVVATAPLSAAAPVAPPPTALPSGWTELGWIDDSGVSESQANAETKHFGWQGGALVKVLRSANEHTWTFQALEENAATISLFRRSTPTTIAGTSEVQTVAITGTPTGGTFTLSYGGQTTAPIVYNATAAVVVTALTALGTVGAGNVTATGGPLPTAVVVTFAGALGSQDVPSLAGNGAALTGGTTPAVTVVTTTPGVNPTNTQPIGGITSQNLRQWAIDLRDGTIMKRLWIPLGEATPSGNVDYHPSDITGYTFLLTAYPDAAGNFGYDINNNPALTAGSFV